VEALLDGSAMSTVNLSEVIQKAEQHGVDTEGIEFDLEALGVTFHAMDVRTARATATLWPATRRSGLSLGDRACLALAAELGADAVTADRRWARVDAVPVVLVRR
jgi:ribonuclease VapC